MDNFYVFGEMDGRATKLAASPRGKDGGFTLAVNAKDRGNSVPVLNVRGFTRDDGSLVTRVYSGNGHTLVYELVIPGGAM